MHCIRCRQEMAPKAYNGVLIDYCQICRSVWLDKGELEQLTAGVGNDEKELRAVALAERAAEASRAVTILSACPKCQTGQIREQLIHGVKLDYCTNCRGLFFDHGELQEAIDNKKMGILQRWQIRLFGV